MNVATSFDRRHPRGVILTRGLVAVWLVVLTGILLAYGYWGVALFTFAAAVVHVVWAYRVYQAMAR
jgi:CHASE2 domain-containing sensor protein